MTIAQRFLTPWYYHPGVKSTPATPPPPLDASRPRLLACSSFETRQQRLLDLQLLGRDLLEDRKKFLEHLTPGNLARSSFRIVVTQSSLVLSTYANDQLQQDVARDKLVDEGKITQEEADDEAIEWETREWKVRWETFPAKLTEALLKFHAITLVMRCYEHVADKIVDKITLDDLTLDTFKQAKRLDAKEENRVEVGRQMFGISFRANLIAFLADYSVHQMILAYGYYAFVKERKRRKQLKDQVKKTDGITNYDDNTAEEEEQYPIVKKSGTLMVSRGLGLCFTAAGGAVGSMLYPGWGTLLGSNAGDSLGGIVADGVLS